MIKGNVLLRDAQLTRMNSEMMGDDSQEVSREFATNLEDALTEVQHLEVNYDTGILHSTLAQTYDRSIFFFSLFYFFFGLLNWYLMAW